jgi:hypothetical protein
MCTGRRLYLPATSIVTLSLLEIVQKEHIVPGMKGYALFKSRLTKKVRPE